MRCCSLEVSCKLPKVSAATFKKDHMKLQLVLA